MKIDINFQSLSRNYKFADIYSYARKQINDLPSVDKSVSLLLYKVQLSQLIADFAYNFVYEGIGDFEELLEDESILAIHLAFMNCNNNDFLIEKDSNNILSSEDIKHTIKLAEIYYYKPE